MRHEAVSERRDGATLLGVDARAAVAAYGGAARWKRRVDMGVTDGQLRAAVRSGALVRLGSVYALTDASADVVAAAQLAGRLTCSSAAARLGPDVLNAPGAAHVAVARNSSRTHDVAIVHRTGQGPGWLVTVPEALSHALGCLPPVESLVMIDSALRLQLTTKAEVRKRLVGPGSVRRRGLLNGWLVIEIDGYAHHSSRDDYRNDRRRANLLAEKRMVLLRFSYEDVLSRRAQMVAQIRHVHASR